MSVSELLRDNNPPTYQRKDLMSLSTLTDKDVKIRSFKKINTSRDWSLNLYNLDIDKSSPRHMCQYPDKIDFTNKNDDIEKSTSQILHPQLNKVCRSYSNIDVEGSMPKSTSFKTNRCVNPLSPVYKLPSFQEHPQEQPKFLRNSMNIDDLPYCHPKKRIFELNNSDTNKFNYFIENSKIRKGFDRKTKFNYIDYSDLKKEEFQSNRHVNVLDPIYQVRIKNEITDEMELKSYGPIEKSKPQSISPYVVNENYHLRNDDIIGSTAGSRNRINLFKGSNSALNIFDIEGTKPGTLNKCSIHSNRHINPLWPKYQYPGSVLGSSLSNPIFDCNIIEKCTSPNVKTRNNKGSLMINSTGKGLNEEGNKCLTIDPNIKTVDEVNNLSNDNKTNLDNNIINDIEKPDELKKVEIKDDDKENIDKKINEILNIKEEEPKKNFRKQKNEFVYPTNLKEKGEEGGIVTKKSKTDMKSMLEEYKVCNEMEKSEVIRLEKERKMKSSMKLMKKKEYQLSYPEKLDLFMLKNNLKFIDKE